MQKPNYRLGIGREEDARIISAIEIKIKNPENERTFSTDWKNKCDCNNNKCCCNEFQDCCRCYIDEDGRGHDSECLIYG
jgi:hypothetical protein